jgi:hypothetical protein
MEQDYYTELNLKIKYDDEPNPQEFTAKLPNWDVDLEKLFYIFKGLVISAGFQEGSFSDCVEEYIAHEKRRKNQEN